MKKTKMLEKLSPTGLFVRAQTFRSGSPKSQKGATALEYIVLAAAIIAIVAFLATNDGVKTALSGAFTDLFDSASSAASEASGG